jgi:protein-S-isoprenylcysteine O-methyltransferase Ste14
MTTAPDHARLIAPPPLIAVAALLVGVGARCIWPAPLWPWPLRWLPAAGCFAAALLLAGAAALTMTRAKTAILPHHTTTALVTSGPFRHTRNPLYVSLGLLLAGVAFAANSLALLLVIVPWVVVMRLGVIGREERYLEGKFGDDYRAYCRRVRRWL